MHAFPRHVALHMSYMSYQYKVAPPVLYAGLKSTIR